MVVMLFLKKPVERRDEASLSWCWHHLIIRSDVNLRLHSIHTDTHAGIIHTFTADSAGDNFLPQIITIFIPIY